jgi:probable H4MPT-linked C1 transfer pathway protein
MTRPPAVLGWDIGGVNTKAARLDWQGDGPLLRSTCVPYELKHEPRRLGATLAQAAREVGAAATDLHAVTMTAELSQAFRTKREGVGFILDALEAAFPGSNFRVYTAQGQFVSTEQARSQPLTVAAANWAATAGLVARSISTCILMDVGTTSTDLIPIVNGRVGLQGHTDPERLLSGEQIYTAALRTPVEAVARQVPLWGGTAGVSADGFAVMGDAHLWLGRLRPADYTCPTSDGRPPTRDSAGDRLARVVCGDREMLDDDALHDIATALAGAQVGTVAEALGRVRQRWPLITSAVVTGLGDFIAAEAAASLGLGIVYLSDQLGDAARTAPAAAVAWLLWHSMDCA